VSLPTPCRLAIERVDHATAPSSGAVVNVSAMMIRAGYGRVDRGGPAPAGADTAHRRHALGFEPRPPAVHRRPRRLRPAGDLRVRCAVYGSQQRFRWADLTMRRRLGPGYRFQLRPLLGGRFQWGRCHRHAATITPLLHKRHATNRFSGRRPVTGGYGRCMQLASAALAAADQRFVLEGLGGLLRSGRPCGRGRDRVLVVWSLAERLLSRGRRQPARDLREGVALWL